ncbi:MAG TPA: response regulator [Syntrophobacteraceae bacterium]|nr:response regulator [Syntrophobacteraceae bacterium]
MENALSRNVLIVDDEEEYRELIRSYLSKRGFSCEVASNGEDALALLQKKPFDVLITDIRMKGMDGIRLMTEAHKGQPDLDVIIITGYAPAYSYTEIVHAGAADFIAKPFEIEELHAKLDRIRRERRAFRQLQLVLEQSIRALSLAMEFKDPYTAGHQRRVAALAEAIALELGLSRGVVDAVRMGGLVHDIGKISVPSEILAKPARLQPVEFQLIRQHTEAGFEILKNVDFEWPIAEIAFQHHERMDGSGYPRGLTGDKTLVEARIIAVSDVVEAMSSHRPYRAALGIDAALEEISRGRGTWFDPEVVDVCVRLFREKHFEFNAGG